MPSLALMWIILTSLTVFLWRWIAENADSTPEGRVIASTFALAVVLGVWFLTWCVYFIIVRLASLQGV